MKADAIDTNVLVVANRQGDEVDDCALACMTTLQEAQTRITVLDDDYRILKEYGKNVNASGQPGVGDAFLKWIHQNVANPNCCERVTLTQQSNDPNDFAEFPQDPDLSKFDPSDRKFVAVVCVSKNSPEILQATDRKWLNFLVPLARHNVRIKLVCPLSPLPRKKRKP